MKAFPVIATCVALGLLTWGALSVARPGAPTYELKHQTIVEEGIRLMPLTTYTYWKISGPVREKLWERKIYQIHGDHWISPSGNVWIIGKNTNPPCRPGLYLLNPKGDQKGQWNYILTPTTNVTASKPVVLRPGVEQFHLVETGRETRITFIDGDHYYSTIRQTPGPLDGEFEAILRDPTYEIPQIPERYSRFATLLAKRKGVQAPEKAWRQLYEPVIHGPNPDTAFLLGKERSCPIPTFEIETSSKRLAFTFDETTAEVSVIGRKGDEWSLDLAKASGLSPQDAAQLWGLESAKTDAFHDATPLSKLQVSGKDEELLVQRRTDVLVATESNGDRHILDCRAEGKPTYVIKRGVEARAPKELPIGLPVDKELKVEAPNRSHYLRIRECVVEDGKRLRRITLVRRTPNLEIELWARPTMESFFSARVLDDGIVLYVDGNRNACSIAFPNSGEGATLDLTRRGVKGPFDLEKLTLAPVGPKRTFVEDRVEYVQADEYKATYNKTLSYRLFRYGQGFATMDLD